MPGGGFGMLLMPGPVGAAGGMVLMKLLGAIWAVEFVTLAGNSEQGNGHKKDGE